MLPFLPSRDGLPHPQPSLRDSTKGSRRFCEISSRCPAQLMHGARRALQHAACVDDVVGEGRGATASRVMLLTNRGRCSNDHSDSVKPESRALRTRCEMHELESAAYAAAVTSSRQPATVVPIGCGMPRGARW